ncbi:methionyl-tRNA formyltransferase [Flavobacterium sp.]|jgi:methionyl-tRNA formyltransferase|uniref:methionyl-tRNA formyltransferase n=1 Tax=Flavobacterium sp. TaxID=239 RepID=UPI0022C2C265|nr:methionyl-tRNA formyltransferase [Flavobacterium sp.]MCZ8144851.1 methionyl-tRNA formyltransferase [Flavobacterium sp.]MCZ8366023.1 methionyl-tRNA formyltransferase [Flavobacterium sp.]
MESLRIVFMGTPEFAVGILEAIVQQGLHVVGVVTAADKPAGRGQQLKFSAVKEYAIAHGLPLLQPTNLKDPDFIAALEAWKANVHVVVAFRMLPEVVWRLPKWGTFNLHASLLPQYRGAAPIHWAIINGETETGVTTFFIDDKIDTGAMILSKKTAIDPEENTGSLHDRLMVLGKEAVLETLERIAQGDVATVPQIETGELKTAYKLNKENCQLDFHKKGKEVYNQIRGLSPFPVAWCHLIDGETRWAIKIYEAVFIETPHTEKVGQWKTSKKEIEVVVPDGYLKIKVLQFPGKKKMTAQEVLNGMHFSSQCRVE